MFSIQETPIDVVAARGSCRDTKNGAMTSFEGIVRSDKREGKEVASLLYIADLSESAAEGEKILKEACSQFKLIDAVCIQRIGQVMAGESAIWIGVWSPHRDEAFKGCRYVIEEVKKRLMIWKKEFFTDGTSQWIHGAETTVMP
jgi:molybdopterin synthase catalytic subunit